VCKLVVDGEEAAHGVGGGEDPGVTRCSLVPDYSGRAAVLCQHLEGAVDGEARIDNDDLAGHVGEVMCLVTHEKARDGLATGRLFGLNRRLNVARVLGDSIGDRFRSRHCEKGLNETKGKNVPKRTLKTVLTG
jgi:hypothetical protein